MASVQDAIGPAVLWLGVHHDDHTGYPDCRSDFIEAADRSVQLGTQHGLRVQAPFVHWTKADIIRWGLAHDVPYELTHSCYQGRRPACGVCDTCQARLTAFAAAGAADPLSYADGAGMGDDAGGDAGAPAGNAFDAGAPAGGGSGPGTPEGRPQL
jgi:7-cyano-7-deazaguanine synthase